MFVAGQLVVAAVVMAVGTEVGERSFEVVQGRLDDQVVVAQQLAEDLIALEGPEKAVKCAGFEPKRHPSIDIRLKIR